MAVTASDLREIVSISAGVLDGALAVFLETAHMIVTEQLSTSGMSQARLDTIELYLAAHFFTLSQSGGNLKMGRLGDAQEEYFSPAENLGGYGSTSFGQQALNLDTSGILAAASSSAKQKAQFTVV